MCGAWLMDEVERKEGHVEGTVDELGSLKDPGGGRGEQNNAWVEAIRYRFDTAVFTVHPFLPSAWVSESSPTDVIKCKE